MPIHFKTVVLFVYFSNFFERLPIVTFNLGLFTSCKNNVYFLVTILVIDAAF